MDPGLDLCLIQIPDKPTQILEARSNPDKLTVNSRRGPGCSSHPCLPQLYHLRLSTEQHPLVLFRPLEIWIARLKISVNASESSIRAVPLPSLRVSKLMVDVYGSLKERHAMDNLPKITSSKSETRSSSRSGLLSRSKDGHHWQRSETMDEIRTLASSWINRVEVIPVGWKKEIDAISCALGVARCMKSLSEVLEALAVKFRGESAALENICRVQGTLLVSRCWSIIVSRARERRIPSSHLGIFLNYQSGTFTFNVFDFLVNALHRCSALEENYFARLIAKEVVRANHGGGSYHCACFMLVIHVSHIGIQNVPYFVCLEDVNEEEEQIDGVRRVYYEDEDGKLLLFDTLEGKFIRAIGSAVRAG
ncbi:hypothetical protein SCHPADRAFT_886432 [Schizopora paradoxa]|uniref:Uncharacterized protein n=1 Tax=Schizopora paradoxa TaxID=27342 RepID=A0A0H2S1G1_9AGAM|nr:hypothetical protein SCHPADRAFT_886432 [Schizopora paradoxa]